MSNGTLFRGGGSTRSLGLDPTWTVLCWETSQCFWPCLGLRKYPNPKVYKELPNSHWMLRWDMIHWLVSSHVASLFRFWMCAYRFFTIVTLVRRGWGLGFRLAQFRAEHGTLFGSGSMRVELSSQTAFHTERALLGNQKMFLALPRLAQVSKPVILYQKLPNLELRYDMTHHVWDRYWSVGQVHTEFLQSEVN